MCVCVPEEGSYCNCNEINNRSLGSSTCEGTTRTYSTWFGLKWPRRTIGDSWYWVCSHNITEHNILSTFNCSNSHAHAPLQEILELAKAGAWCIFCIGWHKWRRMTARSIWFTKMYVYILVLCYLLLLSLSFHSSCTSVSICIPPKAQRTSVWLDNGKSSSQQVSQTRVSSASRLLQLKMNQANFLTFIPSLPSWISFYSAIHLVDCGVLDTNERIRAHVCSPLPSSSHFLVPLHRSPFLFLTYCTQGYHGVTIAAASPDEDYYKEFRKGKCQVFYMPTWDSVEVEQFLKVPGPLRDSVRPEEVCREGRGRAGWRVRGERQSARMSSNANNRCVGGSSRTAEYCESCWAQPHSMKRSLLGQ